MADENLFPIPSLPRIDYARPGISRLPMRLRIIGWISLLVGTIALIGAVGLTAIFGASARRAHDELLALPALIASMNATNAASAARESAIVARMRAIATARAKLPNPRPLTAEEAAHIVDIIQSQLQAPLTTAQSQTLAGELQKPNQEWVDPALPLVTSRSAMHTAPPWQLVLADTGGRGTGQSVRVMTLRSYLSRDDNEGTTIDLGVDGGFRERGTSIMQRLALVRQMPVASSLPRNYAAQLHSDETASLASAIVAAAEILLAFELLIAAILVLRNRPRWTFHHRVFVWGQLVLVLAAAAAWSPVTGAGIGMAIDLLVLAVIFSLMVYPLALLCILPN